jgi:hypothetical protein
MAGSLRESYLGTGNLSVLTRLCFSKVPGRAMKYTGGMKTFSTSNNLMSTTQPCSARFMLWQAPPSCQAQQYQNHVDHFERYLKALVSKLSNTRITLITLKGI